MDTGYMFRVVAYHVLKNEWLNDGQVDEKALEVFLPSLLLTGKRK